LVPFFLCSPCSNADLEGNARVDLNSALLKSTTELPLVLLVHLCLIQLIFQSARYLCKSDRRHHELRTTPMMTAAENCGCIPHLALLGNTRRGEIKHIFSQHPVCSDPDVLHPAPVTEQGES